MRRREFLWASFGSLTFATACQQPSDAPQLVTGPSPLSSPAVMDDYTIFTTPNGAPEIWDAGGSAMTIGALADVVRRPYGEGDEVGLSLMFTEAPVPDGATRTQDWYRQFPGVFVYIGRVETHPFRPCVEQPVRHTHVIIKRHSWTPDDQAWSKLHIGKYTQNGRSCFAIYDSINKWVCLTQCGPTRGELQALLAAALTAAIAVYVAPFIISSMAAVLASVLIVVLANN